MLLVWATYLQLLLQQYRATKRSSILITRAAGKGMCSRCLITNMSSEPLFVMSLIGKLQIGEREIELPLTDVREHPENLGSDPRSRMAQGSLNTGEYLNIGSFENLINLMLQANNGTEAKIAEVEQFELKVVAFHGWEDLPVGAVRSFGIHQSSGEEARVQPLSLSTEQIDSRHRRRRLWKEIEDHV